LINDQWFEKSQRNTVIIRVAIQISDAIEREKQRERERERERRNVGERRDEDTQRYFSNELTLSWRDVIASTCNIVIILLHVTRALARVTEKEMWGHDSSR